MYAVNACVFVCCVSLQDRVLKEYVAANRGKAKTGLASGTVNEDRVNWDGVEEALGRSRVECRLRYRSLTVLREGRRKSDQNGGDGVLRSRKMFTTNDVSVYVRTWMFAWLMNHQ
jgi:hypothetical protein